MKYLIVALLLTGLVPASAVGQTDPTERLLEVLPTDVAVRVLEQIQEARDRALPIQAMADVALEGVAKGRGADEIVAAVQASARDLGRALDALRAAGRSPGPGEIEAAAAAMRMGVEGSAISELARSQPSSRGLAVPLLVMGGLAVPPGLAGPAMGAGPGGLHVPAAGINVPVGPPVDVGGRPRNVPGRPDRPRGPGGPGVPIG